MTEDDDEHLSRAAHADHLDHRSDDRDGPTERTKPPGHWHEATVTRPELDDRSGVFFAAIEMTRMPMILTNPKLPDNPVVFANQAFQELTGYQQDEIIGRNCRFLQGAQTDRSKVAELRSAVEEQRAVSVELLNYKRDGTPFWNGVYIAPVFNPKGDILYFFASQLDITRRRTSEQAFRQAQKMESVGQLTAGLAHDFNNLLQIIAGSLEALKLRLTDARLERYVDRIGVAAERGAKLTRQLLAYARKTRLDPKVINLNSLINGFDEMLQTTVGNQNELQVSLQQRLPSIRVDPTHLEMALLNILINARDAMAGGGNITLSTSTAVLEDSNLPGGLHVALSVTDAGEGMPPHVLERATEPFFTTKTLDKGTGLGLAMVHGFVQQSLGQLQIESTAGHGTTVRMLFPALAAPPAQTADYPLAEALAAAPDDLRGAAETILLVEDNEDVLGLAQDWLQDLGYQVLIARSGAEALAVLDLRPEPAIDLLFTDLLMPGGMNGLVLAEEVSRRVPGIAVLLTTGYHEDLVAEGPRSPAMDVIGKPYRRSELASRVRAALEHRVANGRPRPGPRPPLRGPSHEG